MTGLADVHGYVVDRLERFFQVPRQHGQVHGLASAASEDNRSVALLEGQEIGLVLPVFGRGDDFQEKVPALSYEPLDFLVRDPEISREHLLPGLSSRISKRICSRSRKTLDPTMAITSCFGIIFAPLPRLRPELLFYIH